MASSTVGLPSTTIDFCHEELLIVEYTVRERGNGIFLKWEKNAKLNLLIVPSIIYSRFI